ncbi:MFS transporter [Microterricola pindariensis]|uniref:MFS transporter n=1 Tax=Microterricola pindariensis TaxID=478010 RepID=A0ABX5AQX4_9MICO|nr:MFS transporter [Microterricola pindariensis]PPL14454.1 MFS transporter [Microterricola pindariensis]
MSTSPATDSIETVPALGADAAGTSPAPERRPGGIRAALADPVLRVLVGATLVSTLGRGIFFTLTVLFFTHFVGLDAGAIALILAISSGVGVATSYAGGHFADVFSARRMLVALIALEGLAMASYPFAGDFGMALVLACIATGLNRASNSTRSAMIARAFDAEHRVSTRAILRTVTNIGIAAGGAIGGLALLAGTIEAYRGLMIAAGVVYLLSAVQLLRLPARVDAPPRERRARLAVDADTAAIAAHEVATARQAAEAATAAARSPFRDRRYLALTALAGVFGMQFALGEIGVPLWIVHNTAAPDVMVSALLIVNTVIVIALQIPLSRGSDDIRKAGRAVLIAGAFMLIACGLYALAAGPDAAAGSAGVGAGVAIVLLLGGALFHAFAEILSAAGTWGLSFELAEPSRAGAYQGMFGMGFSLGTMLAPLVITATALELGLLGWAILAVLFVAAAIGIWVIARRAAPVAASA